LLLEEGGDTQAFAALSEMNAFERLRNMRR